MRKDIGPRQQEEEPDQSGWLDLEKLARVQISSEDPAHPLEAALQPHGRGGWRAGEGGLQLIRFLFDRPQKIERIELMMVEDERPRTQEFVLRAALDDESFREIVRQQFNFSRGTSTEREEYRVNLANVTALELEINPDIAGSDARATLERLRVA